MFIFIVETYFFGKLSGALFPHAAKQRLSFCQTKTLFVQTPPLLTLSKKDKKACVQGG